MQIIARFNKTLYEKGDFLIANYLKLEKNKSREFIKLKGYNLPKNTICFYRFNGDWEDSKYGKTFVVESYELTQLKTIAAVKSFFKDDEFQGLGKVIKKVINKFGTDSITVISETPERLFEVNGITADDQEKLIQAMARVNSLQALTKQLSPMGISYNQIKKINDNFHGEAINMIEENPFGLLSVKGIGFRTCDTIARYKGKALDDSLRIEGGVLETLNDNAAFGNTYIEDEDLISKSIIKLNDGLDTPVVTRKHVVDAIWRLIQEGSIVNISRKLFAKEFYDAESFIAKTIKSLVIKPVEKADALCKAIDTYNVISLSDGQKEAVKTCLSNNFSIITGGAGTGKTTVMKAIIYAFKKVYPNSDVTLLAPTGKASRRMSEVTQCEASTIHHALGLCGENQDAPFNFINSGLVIVDEFSMVDTLLFAKLLMAVSSNCRVILMGDPNQLPSVSAGACLKDLIESKQVPVAYLKEIFRQEGGVIVDNSIKTINKDNSFEYNTDMMFVSVDSDYQATEQAKVIYKHYVNEVGVENVALITPLRKKLNNLTCVADELNGIIQEVINPSEKSFEIGEVKYKLYDRVMMWKNTPIASNGDVGTIVSIDTENEDWGLEVTINWENGQTGKYHKIDFNEITLAYAMSVHKSQGSEYDVVIIPVLWSHKCRLFKNNLLYTAITRAKKRVILIGDKRALSTMINNSETYQRLTYLKQFVKEA